MTCPNKNTELWKTLENDLGERGTWEVWYKIQSPKFIEWYGEGDFDTLGYPALTADKTFVNEHGELVSIYENEGKTLDDLLHGLDIETDTGLVERLQTLYNNQVNALKQRLEVYEKAKQSKGFIPKDDSVSAIKSLQEKIKHLDARAGLIEIMKYTKDELSKMNHWLTTSVDLTRSDTVHANILVQMVKQLETYGELATELPSFAKNHSGLAAEASLLNNLYHSVNNNVYNNLEKFMVNFIHKNSTNSKRFPSKADIRKYLKESKDIAFSERHLGGLSNSEDTMLALLHKIVEEKRQEVYHNTHTITETILMAGRRLKAAGVKNFKFMVQENGRLLQRIGPKYYEEKKRIKDLLLDKAGNKYEYIVKDIEDMTEEEKAHNKMVRGIKEQISEFMRAENVMVNEGKVNILPGSHHRYTKAFLDIRKQYEEFDAFNFKWVKKDGVLDGEYAKYLRKYYQDEVEIYVAVKSEVQKPATNRKGETYMAISYEHLGEIELKKMRFPKGEHVEVRDHWEDDAYKALMTEPGLQGDAKREFYEFYNTTFSAILAKLPLEIQQRMKGKLFRVKGDLVKDLSSKGVGFFNMAARQMRKFINPEIITSGRLLDENGNPIDDVPMFFVGDLKNEKRIADLKDAIAALDPKSKDYKKDFDNINNKLLIEQNKLKAEELNYDLVESLAAGAAMAENYDIMKSVESILLIAKDLIKAKKFYKYVNADGTPKVDKDGRVEYKQGISNVQERLDSYLRMIFYSNSDANNSKVAVLAGNFQKFVSFKLQGLNPFSAINNVIMANINQHVEAKGRQFYGEKSYSRAGAIQRTYFTSGQFMEKFKNQDLYASRDPKNKVDAVLHYFNFLTEGSERGGKLKGNRSVKDYAKSGDILFMGIEIGEWQAQSRSGIARLLEQSITNTITGEVSNWYDALEFKDGKLTPKAGFNISMNDIYRMGNNIKNMNKTIHGNYSDADKVALQEFWLGNLAMQFHKWMYNAAKNRFSNHYYDEGTGVEMEGRYRAVVSLFNHMKAYGFTNFKQAYGELSDLEKANMRKNATEFCYFVGAMALYALFSMLAEGIDDDDVELKRLVNFLKKQSDRVRGEITTFINPVDIYNQLKNPVAGLKVLNEFGQFVSATVGVPWYLATGQDKELYYEKGINKGTLKVYKEARDLVPVLSVKAQYDQLLNSGEFFFK